MGRSIKSAFYFLSLLLILWLGLVFLLPLLFPFLLGLGLALAAEPVVALLAGKARLPRVMASGVGVTLAFCAVSLLILALGAFLLRELGLLAGVLPDLEGTALTGLSALQSWLLDISGHAPQSIRPLLQHNVTEFFSGGTQLLDRGVQYLLGLARNILSHVPDSALTLGTAILSGYMISAKLPGMKKWILHRLSREKLQPMLSALKRIKTIASGWLAAQIKLAGVTLSLLLAGFLLLRIPYAPLWALGISLVDAFPVLGTGTVLLPWSLICFLQSDTPRAIGILGIYIVITVTRSVLEPKLLGKHLGLDPLATLAALYIGFKLFGLPGMLFAPMVTVLCVQLLPGRASP